MRAWAIKLGSAGRCVRYCEEKGVVGVGWSMVDSNVLASAEIEVLKRHVETVCTWYAGDRGAISRATGMLWRFARECAIGDHVVYYNPHGKEAVFTEVKSPPKFRAPTGGPEDAIDIWHYRDVTVLRRVKIPDLHGTLKGRLLGPRMSFWELRPADLVAKVASGARDLDPPADPDVVAAGERLWELVEAHIRTLNDRNCELLVADLFRAAGGVVDETAVGRDAVIDLQVLMPRGALGQEVWRVQVKRYTNRPVDWPEIEDHLAKVGADYDRFCFVSMFGFTDAARSGAGDADVALLEARDFVPLGLSPRLRDSLRRNLRLPVLLP